MARISFKLNKGRFLSPDSYDVRKEGVTLAVIQKHSSGGWFSYGMSGRHWNTSSEPISLNAAKKDVLARLRSDD